MGGTGAAGWTSRRAVRRAEETDGYDVVVTFMLLLQRECHNHDVGLRPAPATRPATA
jgi:hypothetical protein